MILSIYFYLIAVLLTIISGYFSVIGLSEFSSGDKYSIMALGIIMEISKISLAPWLHFNWKSINILTRFSSIILILGCMVITNLGIFNHLNISHAHTSYIDNTIKAQLLSIDSNIAIKNDNLSLLKRQVADMIHVHERYTELGAVTKSRLAFKEDSNSTENLQRQINELQDSIVSLNKEKSDLKIRLSSNDLELGSARTLAKLFNISDENSVIIFCTLLMVPFDPLAVFMTFLASISFTSSRKQLCKNTSSNNFVKPIITPKSNIENIIDFNLMFKTNINQKTESFLNKLKIIKEKLGKKIEENPLIYPENYINSLKENQKISENAYDQINERVKNNLTNLDSS